MTELARFATLSRRNTLDNDCSFLTLLPKEVTRKKAKIRRVEMTGHFVYPRVVKLSCQMTKLRTDAANGFIPVYHEHRASSTTINVFTPVVVITKVSLYYNIP